MHRCTRLLICALALSCFSEADKAEKKGNDNIKETSAILESFCAAFNHIGLRVLDNSFTSFASLFMITQWFIFRRWVKADDPTKKDLWRDWSGHRSRILRTFGSSILVYQIYYSNVMHGVFKVTKDNPFWISCSVLFFERVLLGLCVHGISTQAFGYRPFKTSDKTKTIKNVYMDVTESKLSRAFVTFIAQAGLVAYYTFHLNGDPDSHDKANVSQVKWVIAVCTIHVAGDDEVGSELDITGWAKIFQQAWQQEITSFRDIPSAIYHAPWWGITRSFACIRVPYQLELIFRVLFDMFINGFFRSVLLGTVPIMLCVEEPMDFLMDVTAVFFVIKLDDYDDPTSLAKYQWVTGKGFKPLSVAADEEGQEEDHEDDKLVRFLDTYWHEAIPRTMSVGMSSFRTSVSGASGDSAQPLLAH